MSIQRHEVKKVGLLARLLLAEDEIATMTEQLKRIVEYVDQLGEVETDGVEPMAHAVDIVNVFAEDVEEPSLEREAALQNAPHHDGEHYLVPAVLGD